MSDSLPICIVGGGLAGMATALALSRLGMKIVLFEAKRNMGGRAASFRLHEAEPAVDFCQHVSLGCCTNLADFCQRMGIADEFERIRTLHFIGPNKEHCQLTGSRWLPAPLHLLPALAGLKYLTVWERISIAKSLLKLARWHPRESWREVTSFRFWLEKEGQSQNAVEGFWKVILVSALSEDLKNVSVAAARKVFVDGFMATRHSYEMLVPRIPLGELYGERIREQLRLRDVEVVTGMAVRELIGMAEGVTSVRLQDGSDVPVRAVVLTTPWRYTALLLNDTLRELLPSIAAVENFQTAPITGVHLWFDRPITDLPHAVLINRLSHWLFKPGFSADVDERLHYYQVVISASRELLVLNRNQIIARILGELDEIFPAVADAHLERALVVTERHAVFSPLPGMDALRPPQTTAIPNLFVAGDWTDTGWPATMEGAVRSGYLAAERVSDWSCCPRKFLVPDLTRGRLAKLLIRS